MEMEGGYERRQRGRFGKRNCFTLITRERGGGEREIGVKALQKRKRLLHP